MDLDDDEVVAAVAGAKAAVEGRGGASGEGEWGRREMYLTVVFLVKSWCLVPRFRGCCIVGSP